MKSHLLILCFLGIYVPLMAQNKTDSLRAYPNISFYVLDKQGFEIYKAVEKKIWAKDFQGIFKLIHEMQQNLAKFQRSRYSHRFEFFYTTKFTNFDEQLEAARISAITSLEYYEKNLRKGIAKYYDHQLFLTHYLAYTCEVFYKHFWFMGMERYLSKTLVQRVSRDNQDGNLLFQYSNFYKPFPYFDEMLRREDQEMRKYLDIDKVDSLGIGKQPLITYTYVVMDTVAANTVLTTFLLDDITQDPPTDREVRVFRQWIQAAKDDKVWLVARIDGVPFDAKK